MEEFLVYIQKDGGSSPPGLFLLSPVGEIGKRVRLKIWSFKRLLVRVQYGVLFLLWLKRRVFQLVENTTHNGKADGSSPSSPN